MADKLNPIELQKHLGGVDYPASRDALVEHAEGKNAPKEYLDALRGIPDREYDGPSGVSAEVSKS